MNPSDTGSGGSHGDLSLSLVIFQRVSLDALFYASIDELNAAVSILANPIIALNKCIPILFDFLLGRYENYF